jgi:putative ABC transport system permease protein
MMWVQDDIGWDRFHENSSHIYRLESNTPAQPAPLGPHLKANYPEISEAARFYFSTPLLVGYEDKAFNEDGFVLSGPAVFEVFMIPFVAGN